MLILLTIVWMLISAFSIFTLRILRLKSKDLWILAAVSILISLASIFLWQLHLPQSFTTSPWQSGSLLIQGPALLADKSSWPYAVGLVALAVAEIWTSEARNDNEPISWLAILILTALGILSVVAANLITLLMTWTAIDLFELITWVLYSESENRIKGVITVFFVKICGTILLTWINLTGVSSGIPIDFLSIPKAIGMYIVLAVGLRLGTLAILFLHPHKDLPSRGFSTVLIMVSAAASLASLSRIASSIERSSLTPYLLVLMAAVALFSGWKWIRSSNEITGRPFWVLAIASMAIGACLNGNSIGSIGWGTAMIMCGGVLFLFSNRRKSILWIPLACLWTLSTLPFSLTSSAWKAETIWGWVSIILFLPGQILLINGYFRHAIRSNEVRGEAQNERSKIFYPIGLMILAISTVLLGFWGWNGSRYIGIWWISITVVILAFIFTILTVKSSMRIQAINVLPVNTNSSKNKNLSQIPTHIFSFFSTIIDSITVSFEGEGGLLWSFLLLVLIFSLLSSHSH